MVRVEDIQLLDGWKRYTLQEMLDAEIILSHLDGNHGELYPNKDEFVENGVPYLSANCVVDDEIDFTKTKFLTQKRANTFKKGVAINDDVLFAHNATVGPVAILKTNLDFVVLSTTLTYYRCNKKFLLPNYLRLYMISDFFVNQYTEVMRQATRNQVPITKQRTFFHLVPPLPEQQRIVSILDEAFAAIAKAKANAEQNLKNAKELFESYLQGVFEKKGDGWEERKLNEIGNAQTGTTPKTAEKENYGDFIPFIKPADVDFSGIGDIRYDNEGLSEIGLKKGRKMESGSILMVCIGATIGKVGFAEREVSCNQQINSLTVKKEFEPKFIYYAMTSKEFQEKVLLEGKGAQATLPIINKSKWENLTISFPKSKTEQQTIVRQFDALRAETKRLEAIYQQKLLNLEELKKSVLQKAFNGELKTEKVVAV